MQDCPNWSSIIIKPCGPHKLIEATGYCIECPNKMTCLKAKHSAAYWDQLKEAMGFNDLNN
jgi:hypothetical protein